MKCPPRYQIRSWWKEGIRKYYLQKVWYYETWENQPRCSVWSANASITWGSWQHCYERLLKELQDIV